MIPPVEALANRRVLLCVGGGIAAYKACEVARLCGKAGAQLRVALTPAAMRFVSALTFQALTGSPVSTDLFDAQQELAAGHIALADWAELAIVAPATADLMARLRAGLADDVVTATLLAVDPARWLIAPAMNERMWASAATVENVRVLQERGARMIGPAVGEMAERSHVGPGRMSEPAEIVEAAARALSPRDLAGVPVLVTAGPTREPLDPVRFLSNPSSGRMGFALAEAARDRGADVTLIAGPTEVAPPAGVRCLRIGTAQELQQAVDDSLDGARVVVMAAAVADQRPAQAAPQKVKKTDAPETVQLVRTPDILAGLGARYAGDAHRPLLVGFAAETERIEEHAREKLERKNLDLIVANDVSRGDGGFASDVNRVIVLDREGGRAELSGSKLSVAHGIWDRVRARLG
ncbi:MAG TPA: bifunctional phosphopantothenoylcysteine decarboxylase/phosphopantothenate--cysteine ligase CoaBC [Myxococcales bacterium]|nr:bifunctional phosphopantothenoylcysteine decarboxylase/phosphopantothenate--cysteine ligase CoaBC [Myxococcales bacterium]